MTSDKTSTRRSLRCEALPGGGFGLASGPLTDADRAAVASFREFLRQSAATQSDGQPTAEAETSPQPGTSA